MADSLSPRLAAVAAQVPQDAVLVDVGTDHAQLPLHLVNGGRVSKALAVDVAERPLAIARSACAHLRDRIEVRRSDGLSAIRPGEVSCICIAGMGGLTVARILTEGSTVCSKASRIVVQPQGMEAEVRAVLLSMGWGCIHGVLVRDRRHIYVVEAWEPDGDSSDWTADDLRWGKLVRERHDPLYDALLLSELSDIQQGLSRMAAAGQSEHPDARRLRQEARRIEEERAIYRR